MKTLAIDGREISVSLQPQVGQVWLEIEDGSIGEPIPICMTAAQGVALAELLAGAADGLCRELEPQRHEDAENTDDAFEPDLPDELAWVWEKADAEWGRIGLVVMENGKS